MTEGVRIWEHETEGVMQARICYNFDDVVEFEEYVYLTGKLAENKPMVYVIFTYGNNLLKISYDEFKAKYEEYLKLRGEKPITLTAN